MRPIIDTSGTDTGYNTTGGVQDQAFGGPILIPRAPSPGGGNDPPALILTCTIVQDTGLDCQRERVNGDSDGQLHWPFKRSDADKPVGP